MGGTFGFSIVTDRHFSIRLHLLYTYIIISMEDQDYEHKRDQIRCIDDQKHR